MTLDTHEHPLLGFFLNGRADHRGRTFASILGADDQWLEATHDYVQILFPLGSGSAFNPDAPTLDPMIIRAFAENESLRDQQRKAFNRMMEFYGFVVEEDADEGQIETVYIDRAESFAQRSRIWITPGNHNYRRITRILGSLSILSSPQHAEGLGKALRSLYREFGARIGAETFAFWEAAAFGRSIKARMINSK
jgi:hypothetical protein